MQWKARSQGFGSGVKRLCLVSLGFVSIVMITGCEVIPSALRGMPLLPNIESQHLLNARLAPQSSLFVGLELATDLDAAERQALQALVMTELSQYFPDINHYTSEQMMSADMWFATLQAQAPSSDYLLVLRLVDLKEGNIIRTRHCVSHSEARAQSMAASAVVGNHQSTASSAAYSELHPFAPGVHDSDSLPKKAQSKGVVLSESAQGFDDVQSQPTEDQNHAEAMTEVAQIAGEEQSQIEKKQIHKPEIHKKEALGSSEALVGDNKPVVHVHKAPEETVSVVQEASMKEICEVYFASGRDETRLATWLYTAHQRTLIDRSQGSAKAGLFGWQLDTVHDLLRANIQRLAKKYAG